MNQEGASQMKTPTPYQLVIAAGITASMLWLALPACACGSQKQRTVTAEKPEPVFYQTPAIDELPQSEIALQNLIEDLLGLVKAKEWSRASKLLNGLVLPDHQAWFKTVFGDVKGSQLAADYASFANFLASEPGAKELNSPIMNGRTRIHIEMIKPTGDKRNFRDQILSAMRLNTPIYLVLLTNSRDPKDFFHLGYFAQLDGRFRSIGKLRAIFADG
jgi:hypothetical protein